MLLELSVFLSIGLLAGFLAGLLGIGGGLVIVPALVAWLGLTDSPHAIHIAVATSLATIVFTALSSVYAHHRHGAVNWAVAGWLSPGLVLGAAAGAVAASALSGAGLAGVFGAFCLLAGARMLHAGEQRPSGVLPSPLLLAGVGLGIGGISAVVGIGGGTLTVPFLTTRGLGMHAAVATSSACGLPIAVAGMAGFMASSWLQTGLPSGSLGFVWLPAVAGIGVASVLAAPLGARTAHLTSAGGLKRIFGGFLLLLGSYFIVRLAGGG